jgi:monofunctional biosynthetic peptidoglycan transglycosylase
MRLLGRIAAAIPALGVAIVGYAYLTTPDVRPLRTGNPRTTAFIELRAREARRAGRTPRRIQQWVGYNRISQTLKRAVLVAEDASFWEHEGIDVEQIRESMEVNFERREFARGASTITQQLAKNLYLSPSRNPVRKLRELFIARRLEAELTKQRILELYLNLIEWGDGIYGAEAAARTYFARSANELTSEQAALLAAAIINPRALSPAHPSARLLRRQRMIMRRMGAVTPPPPVLPHPVPGPEQQAPADQVTPGVDVGAEPPPPASEEPPDGSAPVEDGLPPLGPGVPPVAPEPPPPSQPVP